MKIRELHINHYGKLHDQKIKLGDHINLIFGKNETGKSTLLSYIVNSFYGVSKSKKGKEYSDFEKYEPWTGETFSGRMVYQLDNGKTYEIYRDFKKKNPKIFDENMEDISKEFLIDKSAGNQFFYEQTKVDEELFLSTLIANQQETRLPKNEQGVLVQKIANLVGTGEDKVSYKIAMDRLNRRQLEEVGTGRTREKPMNMIEKQLQEIQEEKEKLEAYQDKQYQTEAKEHEYLAKIQELEQEMQALQELKMLYETQELEKQKTEVKENIKKQNADKIKEVDGRLDSLREENKEIIEACEGKEPNFELPKSYGKQLTIAIAIIFMLSTAIQLVLPENMTMRVAIIFVSILGYAIATGIFVKKQRKNKQWVRQQREQWKQYEILEEKQKLLQDEIQILEKNNEDIQQEIQSLERQRQDQWKQQKQTIYVKYPKMPIEKIDKITRDNVLQQIQHIQNEINNQKIQLHALQLDRNTILPNLEKLAKMEEAYANLEEQKQDLQKLNAAIDTAKEILEECYEMMRHTVTPKFTQNLSQMISKITNQKYQKVRFHDEMGLIVENETGEYVPATKLSIGTIDQLYLSLRLSMIDDISEEKLPIILDETFAYFDQERLENFLTYIAQMYPTRQILVMTCTDREKAILEKNNIPYELIEL